MQRMPGYIKLFLIFILGLAVAAPLPGAVVSAAPDNGNQSVESYFKNKDKKDTEETDQTNNVPANEGAENESNDVGISFGDIFRMVFALLFVAGLLYVLLRLLNKKNRGYQQGQIIENIGGTPLGGNRSVQMVRIGEKIYVVGVGDSVQLLNVIDDKDEYSTLMEEHNQKLDQQIVPTDLASKLMEKWKQKTVKQTPSTFSSHLQKQLEQLKEERQQVIKEISKKGTQRDE